MKTTPQQREIFKQARRFRKLNELVKKLDLKIEGSERSEKLVQQALLSVSLQGNIKQYLDAIRSAN